MFLFWQEALLSQERCEGQIIGIWVSLLQPLLLLLASLDRIPPAIPLSFLFRLGYEEARQTVATYVSIPGATVEAKVGKLLRNRQGRVGDASFVYVFCFYFSGCRAVLRLFLRSWFVHFGAGQSWSKHSCASSGIPALPNPSRRHGHPDEILRFECLNVA